MSARTLKIRSEQNGTYSKKYLTRMRFVLPSDLMMTDAGNSYLSLQTELFKADGSALDTTQKATGSEYYFSFGDGVQPYSASCIFRTAKLFSQLSGAVIEEINFQNHKTANFEALQNDIDTLGASTSFSGASLSTEVIKNIQSNYSIWTEGGKQELHIRLKDLFPSLNTAVYSLKQSPLIVDLELEVTRDLIMQMTALDTVQEPPSLAASGDTLFISETVSDASCLVQSQVNERYKGVQKPKSVVRPTEWVYATTNYGIVASVIYTRDANGDTAPVSSFNIDKVWTEADAALGGFVAGVTPVIYTQEITKADTSLVQTFQHVAFLTSVTSSDGNTTDVNMSVSTQAVNYSYESNDFAFLRSFNPSLPSKTGVNGFSMEVAPTNEATFNLLRDSKKYVLTETDRQSLVTAGLLKLNATTGEHELIPGVDFTANMRLTTLNGSGVDNVLVASDIVAHEDGANNFLVSNSAANLPRRVSERLSFISFDHASSTIEFSKDLQLAGGDGVNNMGFYHITSAGAVEAATSVVLFILNVAPVAQDQSVGQLLVGAYPQVSKAEIVLKQYPAGQMKMPSLYRTMRVEPFNIPIGFSEFVANFQIEANCYNAYVILPALASSSLMSTGKNVGSWRATIDEVDLTNVDVRISGDYPSTLYFDRLVDTFSNSQMQLRNLEGIATGPEAGKIRIIPIKIYSGMVNGSPILSPTMKRLQVRLLAEVGKLIEGGTAYLYKELYRQY